MIDGDGKFELNGSTRELTDIDPVLYVWTDCEDGLTVNSYFSVLLVLSSITSGLADTSTPFSETILSCVASWIGTHPQKYLLNVFMVNHVQPR